VSETILAFGRGCIKVAVSLFVGTGIGLVTFGLSIDDIDNVWSRPGPPSAVFVAVGTGMLSAGALMAILFFAPKLWKASASAKGPAYEELPH
jgi:hypothetical protein